MHSGPNRESGDRFGWFPTFIAGLAVPRTPLDFRIPIGHARVPPFKQRKAVAVWLAMDVTEPGHEIRVCAASVAALYAPHDYPGRHRVVVPRSAAVPERRAAVAVGDTPRRHRARPSPAPPSEPSEVR